MPRRGLLNLPFVIFLVASKPSFRHTPVSNQTYCKRFHFKEKVEKLSRVLICGKIIHESEHQRRRRVFGVVELLRFALLSLKYFAMASIPFLQTSIGGRSMGLPSITAEEVCLRPQSRFRSWPKRFGRARSRLLPSHRRWRPVREQMESGRRSSWLKTRSRDSSFCSLDTLSGISYIWLSLRSRKRRDASSHSEYGNRSNLPSQSS